MACLLFKLLSFRLICCIAIYNWNVYLFSRGNSQPVSSWRGMLMPDPLPQCWTLQRAVPAPELPEELAGASFEIPVSQLLLSLTLPSSLLYSCISPEKPEQHNAPSQSLSPGNPIWKSSIFCFLQMNFLTSFSSSSSLFGFELCW